MAKKKKKTDGKFEVVTNQTKSGDVVMPIPPDLLKQLGWKEGDSLEFCANQDGGFILRKIN